jgi:hypothetical protein
MEFLSSSGAISIVAGTASPVLVSAPGTLSLVGTSGVDVSSPTGTTIRVRAGSHAQFRSTSGTVSLAGNALDATTTTTARLAAGTSLSLSGGSLDVSSSGSVQLSGAPLNLLSAGTTSLYGATAAMRGGSGGMTLADTNGAGSIFFDATNGVTLGGSKMVEVSTGLSLTGITTLSGATCASIDVTATTVLVIPTGTCTGGTVTTTTSRHQLLIVVNQKGSAITVDSGGAVPANSQKLLFYLSGSWIVVG